MKLKRLNNCKCLKVFFLSEAEILILTTSYVFVSELFWISLLWIQILICDIFKKSTGAFLSKVNILKGQTMSSGWKKLSDIYGKDDLFWFNIETARNPNSNTSKNCGKNAKGRLGRCLAATYPVWSLLVPFPVPGEVLERGQQCRLAAQRVTKEVWQGRWAFSCAGWDSIPEEAAVYGRAVTESARGGRCVCCRQEEMLWDLCFIPNVFFPIASDSVWKSSSEIKWGFFNSAVKISRYKS